MGQDSGLSYNSGVTVGVVEADVERGGGEGGRGASQDGEWGNLQALCANYGHK